MEIGGSGPVVDKLKEIARELRPEERWYLQPFRITAEVDPQVAAQTFMSEEALRAVAQRLASRLPHTLLRGDA